MKFRERKLSLRTTDQPGHSREKHTGERRLGKREDCRQFENTILEYKTISRDKAHYDLHAHFEQWARRYESVRLKCGWKIYMQRIFLNNEEINDKQRNSNVDM